MIERTEFPVLFSGAIVDIISKSPDELDREKFNLHQKVEARIRQMLEHAINKIKTCAPDELAGLQAEVKICEVVLGLPEQLYEEEKLQRKEKP